MRLETLNSELESDNTIRAHRVTSDVSARNLDHTEWSNASPAHITRYWSGEEAPVARHAEVRLIWSAEALSVRYVCNQSEPLVVSPDPQTAKKTHGLWDRDVSEIFIAPDPTTPERYFEFEAAPTGEWIDLAIHTMPNKRETDWDFHSGMSVAARVAKDRILVAMRIPWDDWIHKPHHGERWRVNLFRCVGGGENRGYLAWQPTRTAQPNFHVPQAFGWLQFE